MGTVVIYFFKDQNAWNFYQIRAQMKRQKSDVEFAHF